MHVKPAYSDNDPAYHTCSFMKRLSLHVHATPARERQAQASVHTPAHIHACDSKGRKAVLHLFQPPRADEMGHHPHPEDPANKAGRRQIEPPQ